MYIQYVLEQILSEEIKVLSLQSRTSLYIKMEKFLESPLLERLGPTDAFRCGQEYMAWCVKNRRDPCLDRVRLQSRYGQWSIVGWLAPNQVCLRVQTGGASIVIALDVLTYASSWIREIDSSQAFYLGCLKEWVVKPVRKKI